MASLARTPALFREIIAGRPDSWLDSRHAEDSLSPREVLGHFIYGEEVDWMPRIRQILSSGQDHPFTPFDVYGGNAMSHERGVEDLLAEFETARRANLEELEGLGIAGADLGKTGIHPAFGVVTLDELLSTWVCHDLYHLGQIFKSFSAPFRDAIGPWQEFLNVPNFN